MKNLRTNGRVVVSAVYIFAIAAVVGFLVTITNAVSGCVSTPNGLKFTPEAASILENGFADMCPFEAMIPPPVGPAAVAMCPGEEAAWDALINSETVPVMPPEPPPIMVPIFRRGAHPEPPLVQIGATMPGPHAADLQRKALGLPPGPAKKPTPSPAITVGRAPFPQVADGGVPEAGR